MKKLLLSLGIVFLGSQVFSQAICDIKAPASIAGFVNAAQPSGWGADLNDPVNSVEDTVKLVDDGTASDSLACSNTVKDLTGKIALIYRGTCIVSSKVKYAQNAGAIAAIVINAIQSNNSDSNAVWSPTGNADAPGVTIPVVLISVKDGMRLRAQLEAGKDVVAYLGPLQGYYANDVVFKENKTLRPNFGSMPKNIVVDSNQVRSALGSWIYNLGSADQDSVTLNATITLGTTEVYNEHATVALVSGDSAFVFLPDMALATYPVGKYNLVYTLSLDTVDQVPSSNTLAMAFHISDSLYSMCALNEDGSVISSYFVTYNGATNPQAQLCIPFNKNPLGNKLIAEGLYFGGLQTSAGKSLVGVNLDCVISFWDDEFTNMDDITYADLTEDFAQSYRYTEDLQQTSIYIKFDESYMFKNDQRYMVCLKNDDSDSTFFAYDNTVRYSTNRDSLKLVGPIIIRDDQVIRTAEGIAPSIALNFSKNFASVKENETTVSSMAYPNPANETITVLINGKGNAALTIADLSGRVVAQDKIQVSNGLFKANISTLNAGTYVFNLNFENGTTSQFKVVVAK